MARAKNLTEEQLAEMMDKETFLTPEQCLEYGFCDEIGSYQADQEQQRQQENEIIRQLRQQLNDTQSFRQEMKQFIPPEPPPGAEPGETKNNGQKVLNMMSAFLNAFHNLSES